VLKGCSATSTLARKEIALRNLDSLLERDGFDSATTSKAKRFPAGDKTLDQKLKDTQKELEELRQRKSEEAEFAERFPRRPFKTLTYKIIILPFADKYRLLRAFWMGGCGRPFHTQSHVDLDLKMR